MKSKIDKLRSAIQAEKDRDAARAREKARKRMAKGAKLSHLIRSADTRTKILAGSWALDMAEKSEEFRAMLMQDLDKVWLWRDDDRELFGLDLLSEEEKVRRDISFGKTGRKKLDTSEASLAQGTGSAPLVLIEERETEAA